MRASGEELLEQIAHDEAAAYVSGLSFLLATGRPSAHRIETVR
jgi:hypothetical protein